MEIREVQRRAPYDALYTYDALRRVTAADSSFIRLASKADVNR